MRSMACWELAAAFLVLIGAGTAGEAPPAFTRRPSATRAGDRVRIDFAVDRETDVAVSIENAKGEIVRHLVAGVLGKNPPKPLKANSLSQSIEWDGRDDLGEPAKDGLFKVRVAAGMTPRNGGFPLEKPGEPYFQMGVVLGIGVSPDGSVYTITHRSLIRHKGYYGIQRLTRDGAYAGTVMPFSSQIAGKHARAITPIVDERGRPLMIYRSRNFALLDYMPANPLAQTCVVRKNGNLLMAGVVQFTWERGAVIGLTELRPEGGTPGTPFVRLTLKSAHRLWRGGTPALTLSQDERQVYIAGLEFYRKHHDCPTLHAVFRVALEGDGEMEPLFGDPLTAGADERHLNGPAGLASDGKGHLLVADSGNGRIVVLNERDGNWAGSFRVDNPLWVGVHRASGAIYAYSHQGASQEPKQAAKDELVKLSAWPGSKAERRITLPSKYYKGGRYVLGMDAHSDVPRIWMGQFYNSEAMKRPTPELLGFCDDLVDRFSAVKPVLGRPGGIVWWSVTSDPTHRYVTLNSGGTVVIDDRTGKVLRPRKARGTCMMGPDGLIYIMGSEGNIRRYTMDGKAVPFKAVKPGAWVMKHDEKGRPAIVRELRGRLSGWGVTFKTLEWPVANQGLPTAPSGTSGNERDFTIDRKGNIYVKNRGCRYHGPMKVDVYDRDGNYLRTVIWEMGDRGYGPRLDAQGNLYCVMGVVRKDGNVPDVYKSVGLYQNLFASLVKFSPKGGALWTTTAPQYAGHFGFARPELGMSKETVHVAGRRGPEPGKTLEGALWWRPGFSVYNTVQCHCNGHSFDVDPFGRTFYPDMLRFQIGVLDTNGNEILRFGSYGNRDQRGPYSWVRDPGDGRLRPRQDADAKDIECPFAEPEFAFAFLNGVAVCGRHLYATDTLNQRLLRIRMDYAAEVSCAIQ